MTTYVALGDSLSIDDYAGSPGCGSASLLYRNRDDDFPDWNYRDLQAHIPGIKYVNMAQDGATTKDVLDLQMPELERLKIEPAIITLSAGGNDLLQIIETGEEPNQVLLQVHDNLKSILNRLRVIAPDAQTAVCNVYDPSDGTGKLAPLGMPNRTDALDVLAICNGLLATLAKDYDCTLADIHGHFLGHGLLAGNPLQRQTKPEAVNMWYCRGVEPNAWGANKIRAIFWRTLFE